MFFDREKLLKSLEQFIQKVKGQNNFETEYFLNFLSKYVLKVSIRYDANKTVKMLCN